jgi:hypothetical protein
MASLLPALLLTCLLTVGKLHLISRRNDLPCYNTSDICTVGMPEGSDPHYDMRRIALGQCSCRFACIFCRKEGEETPVAYRRPSDSVSHLLWGRRNYLYCARSLLSNAYGHIQEAVLFGVHNSNCPAFLEPTHVEPACVFFNVKRQWKLLPRSVLYQ